MKLRIAYVIRGLSGSGKSTLSRMIARFVETDPAFGPPRQGSAKIVSTDDFFMHDGVYVFDEKLLGKNHGLAYETFVTALKPTSGFRTVILDNTNSQHWEFENYIAAAQEAGWDVQVIIVGDPKNEQHIQECIKRNTHGVPEAVVRRMSKRFQL